MSKFYLVEFRNKKHKKWHPWARHSAIKYARNEAVSMHVYGMDDRTPVSTRVLMINTDTWGMQVEYVFGPLE